MAVSASTARADMPPLGSINHPNIGMNPDLFVSFDPPPVDSVHPGPIGPIFPDSSFVEVSNGGSNNSDGDPGDNGDPDPDPGNGNMDPGGFQPSGNGSVPAPSAALLGVIGLGTIVSLRRRMP